MSNKTQKANAKKTRSALRGKRKHHAIIYGLVAGVVLAAFVSALTIVNGRPQPQQKPKESKDNLACLTKASRLPGAVADDVMCMFLLETARSDKQRKQGLSGRESLPAGQGMLFDFEHPGVQCMWMKDMKFSLDMLWLNDKKEVIKVVQNISPETYPASYCSNGARYVIELNKGDVQKAGLDTGQQLNF